MKNILLLTDFSEYSNHAIDFAFQMFGKPSFEDKVKFTILNVHEHMTVVPTSGSIPVTTSVESLDRVKHLLAQTTKKWQEKYDQLDIQEKLLIGSVGSATKEFVDNNVIDYVIIGTQQNKGIDKWLSVSHAGNIAHRTKCPVLVVPRNATFKDFEKIVFATDFKNLERLNILNPLQRIVQTQNPELMILNVYDKKNTDESARKEMLQTLAAYFKTPKLKSYFLEHGNVIEGIEEFASGYNADMVTLVGQDRGFIENIFHKSVTNKLISHTDIPLLILNSKNVVPQPGPAKKTFKVKVKDQVEAWKTEIDELNVQLHLGRKDASDGLDETRKKTKEKLHSLQLKLGHIGDVAEDRWDHFKSEISESMRHIKKAFSSEKTT